MSVDDRSSSSPSHCIDTLILAFLLSLAARVERCPNDFCLTRTPLPFPNFRGRTSSEVKVETRRRGKVRARDNSSPLRGATPPRLLFFPTVPKSQLHHSPSANSFLSLEVRNEFAILLDSLLDVKDHLVEDFQLGIKGSAHFA